MFEDELRIYAFNLGYLETLAGDIEEADIDQQPYPGMNTPRWILGHLAIATDGALRVLGGQAVLPEEWHSTFGRGSTPDGQERPVANREELLTGLRDGHARVVEGVENADPEFLATAHEMAMPTLRQQFPSRGNLLAMLLTSHESLHIGQLTVWRRARGWAPLF